MRFEQIYIGETASITHTISADDIDKFIALTGDDNKLHISKEYASKTDFKIPVVHGMLGASFISTIIGTKLPGDGALWFSQTLDFLRPVRVGDTITINAEVLSKNEKARSIELKTEILNQHKQVVTTGVAKVKVIEQIEVAPARISDMSKKSERVVLILGATGGIGRVTALKLAEEGFDVILHYNGNRDVAIELKAGIEERGRRAMVVQANLLKLEDIENMMVQIRRNFSYITGLVNCTTIKIPNVKFKDLDWTYMQAHFDLNIKSTFFILKDVLQDMEERKYGKVVLLTTQYIESPNAELLHYITAKAAVQGFVKALAIEYAPKGININMVSPSMTDTELVADVPQKIKMLTEAKTPMKRLCTPEDVANSIVFLLSDKSNFITGETIRVNGGQVMI